MQPEPAPLEISVSEAKAWVDARPAEVQLIDVREPAELQICAIAGAHPIPMGQIPSALAQLPKDKHLLVLCHHGARSMRVTQFLRANGFTAVTNVAGGVHAWAEQIDPSLRTY